MKTSRSNKPLSCSECRRLKVKCDLSFPCGNCVKRGLEAICPHGELTNGIRGQRVLVGTEALHRRIAELEEALKCASGDRHPLIVQRSSGLPGAPDASTNVTSVAGSNDAEDNLSAYAHLIVDDQPGVTRYFGAASSVYLSRLSSRVTPSTPSAGLYPFLFDLPSAASASHRRAGSRDIVLQYLPEQDVTEHLAEVYYQTFGWITNIVPRTDWNDHFHHVYNSNDSPHPQRLCLLLVILALGALIDSSRPNNDNLPAHLISGARLCLELDNTPSVTLAQILYCYTSFLMNGRNNVAGGEVAWHYLRVGMTIAESIGLHRESSQWDLDEGEATLRRIVFWEIHGYDVLQSIALGRGQCIADLAIDCAIPDDGEDSGFHRCAYMLTRIWSRINERQIRVSPSTYSEICSIDSDIDQYERSLPLHLSSSAGPSLMELADVSRKRMASKRTMLLMYLTEARIALHRGWYVRALKEYPLEPLQSPQSRSLVCCLEACKTLISLVRNMLAIHDHDLNRRFHFFFHLFSACACLAACGILAPGSSLTKLVLSELGQGIDLFRAARRDETAQLERLRDLALAAVRGEATLPSDTEALDLLSARKTIRRNDPSSTMASLSGFGAPFADALPIEVNGYAFDPTAEFDMDAFLREMGLL